MKSRGGSRSSTRKVDPSWIVAAPVVALVIQMITLWVIYH